MSQHPGAASEGTSTAAALSAARGWGRWRCSRSASLDVREVW